MEVADIEQMQLCLLTPDAADVTDLVKDLAQILTSTQSS
jgi:hypothetical protein